MHTKRLNDYIYVLRAHQGWSFFCEKFVDSITDSIIVSPWQKIMEHDVYRYMNISDDIASQRYIIFFIE